MKKSFCRGLCALVALCSIVVETGALPISGPLAEKSKPFLPAWAYTPFLWSGLGENSVETGVPFQTPFSEQDPLVYAWSAWKIGHLWTNSYAVIDERGTAVVPGGFPWSKTPLTAFKQAVSSTRISSYKDVYHWPTYPSRLFISDQLVNDLSGLGKI